MGEKKAEVVLSQRTLRVPEQKGLAAKWGTFNGRHTSTPQILGFCSTPFMGISINSL